MSESGPYIPPSINPSHLQDEDGSATTCSFTQLFSFALNHVENLYTFHPKSHEFLFHYSEGEFMTRLRTATSPAAVSYTVAFIPAAEEHNGINYLGCIQVTYEDQFKALIRVPGERTYDPAGVSDSQGNEVVDSKSFHFLAALTAAKVMAAKSGAELSFVREMHRVTKPVMEAYHHRLWLGEWMQLQVEKACFSRNQPVDYPGYLNTQIIQKVLLLNQEKQSHSREFLSSLKPPANYYTVRHIQALLKDEDTKHKLRGEMPPTEFSRLSRYLEQDQVAVAMGRRLGLQVAAGESANEQSINVEQPNEEEKDGRDPTFSQIKAKVKALEQKYLEGIRAASGNPDITLEKPLSQQCVIV